MKWTETGSVRCDDCCEPAVAFYWQRTGTLGRTDRVAAFAAGLTMHLCPAHDTDVNPSVWQRFAADNRTGAPA